MAIPSYHSNAWDSGPQQGSDQLSGNPVQDYARFNNPWMSKSIVSENVNMRQLMDFGEFLWKFDPTYQQATRRVVSYFLTKLDFFDPSSGGKIKDEDINSYKEFFETRLKIKEFLMDCCLNFCVYGNLMLSMFPPIERWCQCPKCKIIHPASVILSPENPEFKFKYHPKGVRFEATCQQCNTRGDWHVFSKKADFRENVKIQIWNPKEFLLHYDPFTNQSTYTWIISSWIKARVQDGDIKLLQSMPMTLLQAIGEDKPYRFNEGTILHLREPSPVGIRTGGWGVPPSVYSYGLSRQSFALRKMNETLASDYMIPVRVISPAQGPKPQDHEIMDIGSTVDMFDWNTHVRNMWARQRRDPASIHTMPFPVEYQVLGGEGKDLVPGEILIQAEDMQLNAMGYPVQMYRGDLTIQAAPMAARLFEAHWQHIPNTCNAILEWITSKATPELGWKACGVRLEPPKIVDNMDQLMLLMQLYQGGDVAKSTLLRKLELDKTEETRKQMDEAAMEAKLEAEYQQDIDKYVSGSTALQQAVEQMRMAMNPAAQQAAAGGMPPGGGGMAGGAPAGMPGASGDPVAEILAKIEQYGSPNTPIKPTDMTALAQEAAAIFIGLPEMQKRQKLREVEAINPTMKDLITAEMGKARKSQQVDIISQAQQQGGMPM